MIISGLVLQVNPALGDRVAAQLRTIPAISDLVVLDPPGKMVCVLEADSPEASAEIVDRLVQIEGIYAVMPTYIHEVEEEDRWSSPAVHS